MARPTAQDAMTEEELERLLATVNTTSPTGKRNLALFTLMADAGLRVGEALALETPKDLVREGGVITHVQVRHGKGDKQRRHVLTQRAAVRLGVWLEARAALGIGTGPVFCTVSKGQQRNGFGGDRTLEPGRALDSRYVRYLVDRKAKEAGIERHITPHTFRHTFATDMLRKTGNLELTRKALNHAHVSTTAKVYSHLQDRDVEEAIKALRPEAPAAEVDPLAQIAAALAALPEEARAALKAAL